MHQMNGMRIRYPLSAATRMNEDQVIRHYDVTGKICPKYFVEDEAAWKQFKNNIRKALEE